MRIIDITQELFSCHVYPGDLAPRFERVSEMPRDVCQVTNFSLCAHNGTHMDAPLHFIENGQAVDEISLDVFYGPCCVISDFDEALAACACEERLLLKGPLEITEERAEQLAGTGLRLLGVESQSVAPPDETARAHQILLGAGIVLLEGLDLSEAQPGSYTLAAFPLKLAGCEGSPVRAVLLDTRC